MIVSWPWSNLSSFVSSSKFVIKLLYLTVILIYLPPMIILSDALKCSFRLNTYIQHVLSVVCVSVAFAIVTIWSNQNIWFIGNQMLSFFTSHKVLLCNLVFLYNPTTTFNVQRSCQKVLSIASMNGKKDKGRYIYPCLNILFL